MEFDTFYSEYLKQVDEVNMQCKAKAMPLILPLLPEETLHTYLMEVVIREYDIKCIQGELKKYRESLRK